MSYQEIAIQNTATIMRKQNLSQNSLAAKMGVSKSTLSLFMNNKTTPRLDFLEKLTIALGVPLSDLFESKNFDSLSYHTYLNALSDVPETSDLHTVILTLNSEQIKALQAILKG